MSEKIVNYEDEIDLRELFKTIWRYKYLILIFTSLYNNIINNLCFTKKSNTNI